MLRKKTRAQGELERSSSAGPFQTGQNVGRHAVGKAGRKIIHEQASFCGKEVKAPRFFGSVDIAKCHIVKAIKYFTTNIVSTTYYNILRLRKFSTCNKLMSDKNISLTKIYIHIVNCNFYCIGIIFNIFIREISSNISRSNKWQ